MATNRLPKIIEKGSEYGQRKHCPRTHYIAKHPQTGTTDALFVRKGYRAEVCAGEAHSNAFIDNCMCCAPMWGVMAVKVSP